MSTAASATRSTHPPAPLADPDLRSVPALLVRNAREHPREVALRRKHLGRWQEYSWSDYLLRASRIGLGLRALGVGPGDRVAVHSDNRPAWPFVDVAAQGIGAVTVGVYPTSPAAEVHYLLEHSETVVVVTEDEEQFDKVMAVRDRLPALRHIVVVDARGVSTGEDPTVLTLADLEALGDRQPAEQWSERATEVGPEDLAILVYTSGTTGPPKGAKLTQRNLLAAAAATPLVWGGRPGDEVLSYLPLSHIVERLLSVVNALSIRYVVNFGEGGDAFAQDLRDVQPTFFFSVPRLWEKMLAAVEIKLSDATPLKRAMARWWLRSGAAAARRQMSGAATSGDRVRQQLGELLVYRSIRDKLGLRRVGSALSGAAPVAPVVLEFFWTIGVPVREAYGQTENTAMATCTPVGAVRLGSVGVADPGVELRIADDGEILTRSAAVFAGYFKDPAATAAVLDAEGWLHSGDVGVLDDDGYLTITDRQKDIIITSGGKNISPSEIENKLKVSPYVREAVVIGDRRKYVTALIGIEGDTVGDWATRRRLPYTTYRDLSSRPEVRELVGEWVSRVNEELASVESVKKFALLPKELDAEEGELTATQKVKRAAIGAQFADLIEAMYRE